MPIKWSWNISFFLFGYFEYFAEFQNFKTCVSLLCSYDFPLDLQPCPAEPWLGNTGFAKYSEGMKHVQVA